MLSGALCSPASNHNCLCSCCLLRRSALNGNGTAASHIKALAQQPPMLRAQGTLRAAGLVITQASRPFLVQSSACMCRHRTMKSTSSGCNARLPACGLPLSYTLHRSVLQISTRLVSNLHTVGLLELLTVCATSQVVTCLQRAALAQENTS